MKLLLNAIYLLALMVSFSVSGAVLSSEKKIILEKDSRNKSVDFNLFSEGEKLRFCVNGLQSEASTMDVFRIFLHSAELLKDKEYEKVELCFRGKTKFTLSGENFKIIGVDFPDQNPMYTIRTFPEKLLLPDGERAYKEHRGGVLYLVRVQMEDFQDLNGKWYMNEIVEEIQNKLDAKRPKEFAPDEEVF